MSNPVVAVITGTPQPPKVTVPNKNINNKNGNTTVPPVPATDSVPAPAPADATLFSRTELQTLIQKVGAATRFTAGSLLQNARLDLQHQPTATGQQTYLYKRVKETRGPTAWEKAGEEVKLICRYYPDQCQHVYLDRQPNKIRQKLPLHWALNNGAPDDVIKAMIRAYPAGVAACDPNDGSLPIHMAAYAGCNATVINTLLYLHPWSLDVNLNGSKYTPLACTNLHRSFRLFPNHKADVQAALSEGSRRWVKKRQDLLLGFSDTAVEIMEMSADHGTPPPPVDRFYEKLMEDCDIIQKLDELIPLIEDVHQMKFYYTLASAYSKLNAFSNVQHKQFIHLALKQTSSFTRTTEAVAIFRIIMNEALHKDYLIDEFDYHSMDATATLALVENATFIKDLQATVKQNTVNIKGLEGNIGAVRTSLVNLQTAIKKKQKAEAALGFVALALNVISLGTGGTLLKALASTVDFCGNGELLEELAGYTEEGIVQFAEDSTAAIVDDVIDEELDYLVAELDSKGSPDNRIDNQVLARAMVLASYRIALPSQALADDKNKNNNDETNGRTNNNVSSPCDGTSNSVDVFLAGCGLSEYSHAFRSKGYDDMELLASPLSTEDIDEICVLVGLLPGHKLKFKTRLAALSAAAANSNNVNLDDGSSHSHNQYNNSYSDIPTSSSHSDVFAENSISSFLAACGLGAYEDSFRHNGFDNIEFLTSSVLEREDIDEIAKTAGLPPRQQKLFTERISALKATTTTRCQGY